LLTAGDAAGDAASTEMSLAYGLLFWVGTPIAFVALLPLFGGILKVLKKTRGKHLSLMEASWPVQAR
jgi:energy-converting hydrogenase Eha subunit H